MKETCPDRPGEEHFKVTSMRPGYPAIVCLHCGTIIR